MSSVLDRVIVQNMDQYEYHELLHQYQPPFRASDEELKLYLRRQGMRYDHIDTFILLYRQLGLSWTEFGPSSIQDAVEEICPTSRILILERFRDRLFKSYDGEDTNIQLTLSDGVPCEYRLKWMVDKGPIYDEDLKTLLPLPAGTQVEELPYSTVHALLDTKAGTRDAGARDAAGSRDNALLFFPIAFLQYQNDPAHFTLVWMLEKQEFWLLYQYGLPTDRFETRTDIRHRETRLPGLGVEISYCRLAGLNLTSMSGSLDGIAKGGFCVGPVARLGGVLRPI